MAIDKHVICGCFHVNMVIEFKQYKKRKGLRKVYKHIISWTYERIFQTKKVGLYLFVCSVGAPSENNA